MFRFIFCLYNAFSMLNNSLFIQDHNSKNLSYDVIENQFINSSYENEFNINHNHLTIIDPQHVIHDLDLSLGKRSVDWRKEYKVSSVKNQENCGSCWSFSAVGSVESAWAIKHNQLYNLSEQELIDCSSTYGNQGCHGGSMDAAFEYIIQNGLCSNNSYPYTANQNMCVKDQCKSLVSISNYSNIERNNEKLLERALIYQPISIAIQANKRSFQFYKSGVYSDLDCGTELDHGVLLVGFGYDHEYDMKYWIVKNSWGKSWGEDGYIRLLKNVDDPRGLCGIAMNPSIPII